MLHYIALGIIILLLSISLAIRVKFQFWAIQPVFHIYDLHHWIFTNKIIDEELPKINKYVKLLDVETYDVKKAPREAVVKSSSFLANNFLRSKFMDYIPKESDIMDYLYTTNGIAFLSIYGSPSELYTKTGIIKDREIEAVITSRPLHVQFKNEKEFVVNYVDNLCVRKGARKKGIAPRLIQTHHYHIRHLNHNVNVCLFKREGAMTAIVPLTTYSTLGYTTNTIPNIKLNVIGSSIVKIEKTNFIMFKDFMKASYGRFECTITSEVQTIQQLVAKQHLIIYCMVVEGEIIATYVFRNTPSYSEGKKCVELVASVNKAHYEDLFYTGFCSAIRRLKRKWNVEKIFIETTGDSGTIVDYLTRNGVKYNTSCPTAFFFYNYAHYSVEPNKLLIVY